MTVVPATLDDQQALAEFNESFRQGPIIDDAGRRLLVEAKVGQINGLKVEIFSDEHPPPHFRVSFQGEAAIYSIKDGERITGGLGRFDRNIHRWHRTNKDKLIAKWDETRPSDCPVGPYRE
jgi:uncharacterized protein DUF4160